MSHLSTVLASAIDSEGNFKVPIAFIVIAGLAKLLFILLATICLWNKARNISKILISSTFILFFLGDIQEINTTQDDMFILFLNLTQVTNFIMLVLVIIILFKSNCCEIICDGLEMSNKERDLIQKDLRKGDRKSAIGRIAAFQEKLRQNFKKEKGFDIIDITPEIGREIAWADIVNQVFRVLDFERGDTIIEKDNQVIAQDILKPYGYLLVESPIFNQRVRLPIIHRDDFLLAASVFDEPKLEKIIIDAELLVTYSPKHLLPNGWSGSFYHVLHYIITPHGTLNTYYSMNDDLHMAKPNPKILFGPFEYEGVIRVKINPEPMLLSTI